MKKLLIASIIGLSLSFGFAQEVSVPQNIKFKGKEYTLNYSYEFNDKLDTENLKWPSYEVTSDFGIFTWLSKSENIVSMVNLDENIYTEDGILHLKEHHYVDENGVFHQNPSEIWGIDRGWKIENPNISNKGFYEIKLKMPKVKGVSFAIFLQSIDWFTDEIPTENYITNTGYYFDEIDFAELKSFGNKVQPLGGVHVIDTKTKTKVSHGYEYNEETFNKLLNCPDEWFEEWHILQVVWEDYKMEIYYDGKLFRKVNILKKWGEAVGDYGFIIRPEYCAYPWESNPNTVDWEDTEKHDFQVDYVRVYSPK